MKIYRQRLKKISNIIEKEEALPLLVVSGSNLFYLTGFSGSSGFLVIFPQSPPVFLCDGRYSTQARQEIIQEVVIQEFFGQVSLALSQLLHQSGFSDILVEEGLPLKFFFKLKEKGINPKMAPPWIENLRQIKEQMELEKIKKAIRLSEEAFTKVRPLFRPGVTERDIAIEIDYQVKILGAEESAFPTIVAAGENSALPHAQPRGRALKEGDWVIIDWGARFEGYCADITRTVPVGKVTDQWFKDSFPLILEAQRLAQNQLKEGVTTREVDKMVRQFLDKNGLGQYFSHALGHGIGIQIHEEPSLSSISEEILKEGMVITIEPGVYLPGKGGIRVENDLVVEKEGCTLLTRLEEKLENL